MVTKAKKKVVKHDKIILSPQLRPGLWKKFIKALVGPDGCNFYKDPKDGEACWKCYGDYRLSRKIIKKLKMDNVNVERTLKEFHDHGGHCDCEVVFNVDR